MLKCQLFRPNLCINLIDFERIWNQSYAQSNKKMKRNETYLAILWRRISKSIHQKKEREKKPLALAYNFQLVHCLHYAFDIFLLDEFKVKVEK